MSTIPTPNEYEQRERLEARRAIDNAGKDSTRAEFAEDKDALKIAWSQYPELFAERVRWLLAGNYGYGAYAIALEVAQTPRMNRTAALGQMTAALEYRVHPAAARQVWHKLTPEQQETLTRHIQNAIDHTLREIRGETEQSPTLPQESAREAIRDEGVCTCGTVLRQTYKCIVDPKNDRYACDACGKTWTRYAGTRYETAAERAKRTAN